MKQYPIFLFDFDGTLLDSNDHVIHCFQEAFKDVCGSPLPLEKVTATFGIPLREAIRGLAPEQADELIRVYRRHSDALGLSMMHAMDGAVETLRALHDKGCINAIVTSKMEVNARAQMDHIGITDYVDLLVGPEKTTAHKPDPAPVNCALQLLDARPEDCLMIGDSPYDILCGRNAHVDTCGVRFTAVNLQSLLDSQPTYMIDHLSELLAMARPRA
ncbi:MAG: HAD hydrolase-like protein [Peptococcaceae bacterium]|nr:HAD hydrolase-like protein [Peptococcaceae bacterium]